MAGIEEMQRAEDVEVGPAVASDDPPAGFGRVAIVGMGSMSLATSICCSEYHDRVDRHYQEKLALR